MRRCASKNAEPRRGWIWWGPTSIGERNECKQGRWALDGSRLCDPTTLYKGVETLRGRPERESPKRTISASGGLGPLQIMSCNMGTKSDLLKTKSIFPRGKSGEDKCFVVVVTTQAHH